MKRNNKNAVLFLSAAILFSMLSGCVDSQNSDIIQTETQETEAFSEPDTETNISSSAPLKATEELYGKLNNITYACERYYAKTKDSKEFYTWAGILSTIDSEGNQKEITPQTLLDLGYLNEENFVPEAFNLYMKPKDIYGDSQKTGLEIFTAVETTEGYIICGNGYEKKLIPSEDFRQIILNYNPDNGKLINPETNGTLYNSLLMAIAADRKDQPAESSTVPNYIVRYVSANDLYAVVILSGSDDVTDITEYLLKKENDSWSVVKKALENEENIKLTLNREYPNLDQGLLPPYTLYEYRKQVMTTEHYTNILEILKNQNTIDKSDTVTYCCGTPNVLYLEFSSGKKIAGGASKEGEFSCNFVKTYEDAIKELARFGQPVPAFILKYNH